MAARQIMPTKFVDRNTLYALGVTEGVRTLFRRIAYEDLLRVYTPTYRRITLEVLSTFTCSMVERWMKFQVFNEDFEINFVDVGWVFGCAPGHIGEPTSTDSDYGNVTSRKLQFL